MKQLLIAVFAVGIASTAVAQGKRHYDPATVTTVSGKIAALDTVAFGRAGLGLHATLAGASPVDVRLGPVSYLQTLPVKLAVGDEVSVTGSRMTVNGKSVLIAAEVRRGADTLKLRDAAGRPVWAGRGRW